MFTGAQKALLYVKQEKDMVPVDILVLRHLNTTSARKQGATNETKFKTVYVSLK